MESEGPLAEPCEEPAEAAQETAEAFQQPGSSSELSQPPGSAGGGGSTSVESRPPEEEPSLFEGGAVSTSLESRPPFEELAPPQGGAASTPLDPRPQAEEQAVPEGPAPGPLSRGPPVAAGDEFEEVQDFSTEPLESRFESKDLNRRCSAYGEVAAEMAKVREGASPQDEPFPLLRRHISTVLGETLPKGQDAGLNALTVYLENCPGLDQEDSAPDVLGLVRKLIEHKSVDKPKMQQLSPGIVVLVGEICQCPGTVKEITDCLVELDSSKKKTQGFLKKQIAFAIKLFYHLIAEFGLPKMSPKLGYLTLVLKYLADSDRGIREACYSVVMELSAWMGDLPDAVKSLEEPQKKELMKRLAALSEEERARAEAKRIYRCERGQAQAGAEGGLAAASAFDRAETVDGLKKLPKGWCVDKVFSMEKWKDKQQHLAVLAAAVDAKRLAPGEGYNALVPALVRLLKTESNIPILMEAAKCVGLIAKGLRSEFDRPMRQMLAAALTRINDKSVWKQNVLIERVEQMLWAVPFEAFLEELRQYMNSKSTWTKKEAMNLLLRTLELPQVQESCPDAFQRFFPSLAALIIPAADDADNSVRHEACRFLAVLVHQNRTSPNLGPMVLEKYPMHRLSAFEEEWKKLDVAQPCPLKAAANEDCPRATSQSASMVSRRGAGEGGARSRPTSPLHARPGSPRQERRPPESPSKMRREASAKSTREAGAKTPVRSRSADNSSQLDEQSILESSIVKDMAEEIKSLRAQLQRAQETAAALASAPPAPAASSAPMARTESRLRPGAGAGAEPRSPAGQPRAAPNSGTAAVPVPATPRCAAPLRAQSAGRAEDAEALRQPERRLSGPRSMAPQAESSIPPPATARPSQRTTQASAVQSRLATPRASSGEARTCREGASTTLRREASAGALTPTPGVGFKIELPKLPKQVRQQRDRCQHWGPDPIAAEHLTVMKESWKCSVNDRLYRCMFSDRMEEQLIALQSWKHQVTSHVDTVLEVLDLLLKWLTWMLFNTNTQIWKLTLEVFGHLLDRLAEAQVQLTEREASILATNILERSGHNIQSVRENMMAILRQILLVYPRTKLLPLVLAALASKNKRSAACAMRLLGDALDRQVAAILAKSHKDLAVVLKMIDDKDPDVRRAALVATASLSQHLDAPAFDRIVNFLPKSTQPIVKVAAAKLPPPPQPQPVMQASADPPSPSLRRSVSATSTGLASPGKYLSHTPLKAPLRSSTPKQEVGQRWPAAPQAASSGLHPPTHPDQAHASSASTSPSGLESVPVVSLTQRLVQCSGEDFRTLCGTLKSRTRHLTDAEAVQLAEALVSCMRMYFGHDGCADRCTPLVELLDEFCATKECSRPLPISLLRGLLKEQLRNLQYSGWTRRLENGAVILKMLNLSCVMLLNGICRQSAYSLLLELGTDESEAVHSSLVVKCLRKLNKTFNSSKNVDAEVVTALDVVKQWLERVHPRLLQTDGQERGMVESAAASLMDGVKEVVDAAKTASLQAARSWADQHEAAGEEARIVREWIINGTGSQSEKENQPAVGSPGPNDTSMARKEGGCTPLKSRMSSPAVLRSPRAKP